MAGKGVVTASAAAAGPERSHANEYREHVDVKLDQDAGEGLTAEQAQGLVTAMQSLNERRRRLELDTSASVLQLGRALSAITWPTFEIEQFAANVVPALALLTARISAVSLEWERVSPDLLPPNLRAVAMTPQERDLLHDVLLNEAIPLAYAMPEETVASVLKQPTPSGRKERVWSRRAGILSTCEERLGSISAWHLNHKADLAWQAVQAFRAGLHGPAQAQAIAIMDTHFTIDAPIELERLILDSRKPHDGLLKLERRAFPVLAPIHAVFNRPFRGQAHKHGKPRQKVPRQLSRHATVHGAEARQYSKRNALLSIAMVTGLLCLLQDEHSRAAFSRN
ncbi:hypothetical protein [Pseudoclavibacter sp. VKM Ac-2867]|uniref:hypothetical protein n=1 Tax=Pseudoclavibacter sp. VKM Ac-2867 TaxID=2783829 RepID=UPI00188ADCC3|nr:hypothetical protein [Pseudoclavibacter sp. VKM Ac-2867]MBF4459470.1 hypothetical protein [Pseudoclavibacter sp. VKM Ac-2867]